MVSVYLFKGVNAVALTAGACGLSIFLYIMR